MLDPPSRASCSLSKKKRKIKRSKKESTSKRLKKSLKRKHTEELSATSGMKERLKTLNSK